MFRIGEFIETESKLVVVRGWENGRIGEGWLMVVRFFGETRMF